MGKVGQVACPITDSTSLGQVADSHQTEMVAAAAGLPVVVVVAEVECVAVVVVLAFTTVADITIGEGHAKDLDPFRGIFLILPGAREGLLGAIAQPKHRPSLPSILMPFVKGQKSVRL